MPKISEAFASKWISAADVPRTGVDVTIQSVTQEEMPERNGKRDPDKLCVWFEGKDKGLLLNKTNATEIAKNYGDDTDDWGGCIITLYTTTVQGPSGAVDGIRLRPKSPPKQQSLPVNDPSQAQDPAATPAPDSKPPF